MLTKLNDNDFLILEGYWRNYREYRSQLTNPMLDSKKRANLERIVQGIESTYNNFSETYRMIIQMVYWKADGQLHDWHVVASQLNYTRSRINRMRIKLLQVTAENIGYF